MLWELVDVMVAAVPDGLVKVTVPETGRSSVSVPAFHMPSAMLSPPVKVMDEPLPENWTVPAPVLVSERVPFCEMKEFERVKVLPEATKSWPFVRSWKLILFAVSDAGALR